MKKTIFYIVALFIATSTFATDNIFVNVPKDNNTNQWNVNSVRAVHFFNNENYSFIALDGSVLLASSFAESPLWIFSNEESSISNNPTIEFNELQQMMIISRGNTSAEIILQKDIADSYSLRIFDISGKIIFNESRNTPNNILINTQNFPAGIYSVCIVSDSNVYQSKFIKQ